MDCYHFLHLKETGGVEKWQTTIFMEHPNIILCIILYCIALYYVIVYYITLYFIVLY